MRKAPCPGPKGGPEDKSQEKVGPSLLNQKIQIFEVVIFNHLVREAINLRGHHPLYHDEWSENRYVEFEAESPRTARRKLESRYPKHLGFVIVDVINPSSKFD